MMEFIARLNTFLKQYYLGLFIVAVLLVVTFSSLSVLTTWPRLWVDEAKDIELARGFWNAGKLDIEIAPGQFSGVANLLQSTGYPVTVPLAAVFKLFGYGIEQARAYMLLWMVISILVIFFVARIFLGDANAIFSVLLIATFASFYDNGRAVVGEIPGFVFLLLGLYFWLHKGSYYMSGLLLGLSVVSKPSVFTWVVPAFLLVLAVERSGFVAKIFKIGSGAVFALLVWAFLVLENVFSLSSWSSILSFYSNPYETSSLLNNFITNLSNVPYSTTLIYFGGLFTLVFVARLFSREERVALLYNFVIIYGVFAFIYYLRSPGWLRYIIAAELLILLLLPHAISLVVARLKLFFSLDGLNNHYFATGFLVIFLIVQVAHLFTSADIFFSDSEVKLRDYVDKEFPTESIATLNSVTTATLFGRHNRFLTLDETVMRDIETKAGFRNIDPFAMNVLPDLVISSVRARKPLTEGELSTIEGKYQLARKIDSYSIYRLIK